MCDKKSSLYSSRYYAEACNEWRGPSLRLSAWVIQLRKKRPSNGKRVAILCSIWPARESNPKPAAPIALSVTATPTKRLLTSQSLPVKLNCDAKSQWTTLGTTQTVCGHWTGYTWLYKGEGEGGIFIYVQKQDRSLRFAVLPQKTVTKFVFAILIKINGLKMTSYHQFLSLFCF